MNISASLARKLGIAVKGKRRRSSEKCGSWTACGRCALIASARTARARRTTRASGRVRFAENRWMHQGGSDETDPRIPTNDEGNATG